MNNDSLQPNTNNDKDFFCNENQIHNIQDLNSFKAMTFNIAHGRGTKFHQTLVRKSILEKNLQEIARQIMKYQPHIVALQEIDNGSFWNHHIDQLAYIRNITNYMHSHHGIHKDDFIFFKKLVLKYGVGILSQLEPLDFISHPFSLGMLDTKGFTRKRFLIQNKKIMIIALHLDFGSHKRRLLQCNAIINHVEKNITANEHLIIMGDFNCTVKKISGVVHFLMKELNLHTFEPDNHKDHVTFPALGGRRLDYILIDQNLKFDEYITGSAKISDHEYVVAKITFK